jgi:hypothetical protein
VILRVDVDSSARMLVHAANKKLVGTGTGARVEFADIDPSFLELSDTKIVDEPIVFERDSTKRNYLHPSRIRCREDWCRVVLANFHGPISLTDLSASPQPRTPVVR